MIRRKAMPTKQTQRMNVLSLGASTAMLMLLAACGSDQSTETVTEAAPAVAATVGG